MTLSIRNQLPGTVTEVHAGQVMATVQVRLDGGPHLLAAITLEAAEQLSLAPGRPVHALVKSTEVALAARHAEGLSIRNRFPGTVTEIRTGEVMASVRIATAAGELTAVITRDAVADLGLFVGSEVIALIKATEVSLATP
ncbi:molybdopterin-binding protein [Streptomyces achromogenes]|uniref:TOBE domain-containing protein n=1 Tax=Streptomyces achromogenes TaxID=67255 RepID=UPI0036F94D33